MNCETFKQELKGLTVICDGDTGYDNDRKVKNARFNYMPCCIVTCKDEKEVKQVVDLRRKKYMHVPVRIRSGGHQHEGMCSANNAIIIDLSEMNSVDPVQGGMAWIEPGAKLEKVYEQLELQDYTLPGGGCGTVNVGGLVQGGGWGMLCREGGLTCDSLQAVKIVTAKGEIIDTEKYLGKDDKKYNCKDLLWAIRGGGGGNFGVITKYKFKLMQHQDAWLIAIRYSSEKDKNLLKKVLKFYLDELPKFDNKITSFARVSPYDDDKSISRPTFKMTFQCLGEDRKCLDGFIERLKEYKDGHHNFFKSIDYSPKLKVSNAFSLLNGSRPQLSSGGNEESFNLLDSLSFSLQPLGKVADQSIKVVDQDIEEGMLGGPAPAKSTCGLDNLPHKVSSAFPKKTDDMEGISNSIIDFVSEKGDFKDAAIYLSIHSLGGNVKDDENAENSSFFYRNKRFMLQFQAWWKDEDKEEYEGIDKDEDNCESKYEEKPSCYMKWIKDFRQHLEDEGHIEGAFINFPDRNLVADPTAEKIKLLEYYYGGNLNKLIEIKDQYDPNNFFSFGMSIPPKDIVLYEAEYVQGKNVYRFSDNLIKIKKAPSDTDWKRWSMLYYRKRYLYFFQKKSREKLYAFEWDGSSYTYQSSADITLVNVPKEADVTSFSIVSGGDAPFLSELYLHDEKKSNLLHHFVMENPGSKTYRYLNEFDVIEFPSDADWRRWSMLHDGSYYHISALKSGSNHEVYQGDWNRSVQKYQYNYQSNDFSVENIPSDSNLFAGIATMYDRERKNSYLYVQGRKLPDS